MTPEAQRIAIAKACGWEYKEVEINLGDIADSIEKETGWVSPDDEYAGSVIHLPDYLNDLNAMHEAEATLERSQYFKYIQAIYKIVVANSAFIAMLNGEETTGFFILHATAAQRAEAFLRTLNLWKDTTP